MFEFGGSNTSRQLMLQRQAEKPQRGNCEGRIGMSRRQAKRNRVAQCVTVYCWRNK